MTTKYPEYVGNNEYVLKIYVPESKLVISRVINKGYLALHVPICISKNIGKTVKTRENLKTYIYEEVNREIQWKYQINTDTYTDIIKILNGRIVKFNELTALVSKVNQLDLQ